MFLNIEYMLINYRLKKEQFIFEKRSMLLKIRLIFIIRKIKAKAVAYGSLEAARKNIIKILRKRETNEIIFCFSLFKIFVNIIFIIPNTPNEIKEIQ